MRQFAILTKYTKTHEWIKIDTETKIGHMGITDFAQKELGDIVFVDLPDVGGEFNEKDHLIAIESVKTAADVSAPMCGEVISVNQAVADDASILNSSPEDEGWCIEIKISKPEQLENLLSKDQYKE